MAFLITQELIFWLPNFGFFFHFSASLKCDHNEHHTSLIFSGVTFNVRSMCSMCDVFTPLSHCDHDFFSRVISSSQL